MKYSQNHKNLENIAYYGFKSTLVTLIVLKMDERLYNKNMFSEYVIGVCKI